MPSSAIHRHALLADLAAASDERWNDFTTIAKRAVADGLVDTVLLAVRRDPTMAFAALPALPMADRQRMFRWAASVKATDDAADHVVAAAISEGDLDAAAAIVRRQSIPCCGAAMEMAVHHANSGAPEPLRAIVAAGMSLFVATNNGRSNRLCHVRTICRDLLHILLAAQHPVALDRRRLLLIEQAIDADRQYSSQHLLWLVRTSIRAGTCRRDHAFAAALHIAVGGIAAADGGLRLLALLGRAA